MTVVFLTLIIGVLNICLGFVLGVYVQGIREPDTTPPLTESPLAKRLAERREKLAAKRPAVGTGAGESEQSADSAPDQQEPSNAVSTGAASPSIPTGPPGGPAEGLLELGIAYLERLATLKGQLEELSTAEDDGPVADLVAQAQSVLNAWVGEHKAACGPLLQKAGSQAHTADTTDAIERGLQTWTQEVESILAGIGSIDTASDVAAAKESFSRELNRLTDSFRALSSTMCELTTPPPA